MFPEDLDRDTPSLFQILACNMSIHREAWGKNIMNSRGCMVSDPVKLFERKLAKAKRKAVERLSGRAVERLLPKGPLRWLGHGTQKAFVRLRDGKMHPKTANHDQLGLT